MILKMDPQLLGGIYELPHRSVVFDQNPDSCSSYMELMNLAFGPLWNKQGNDDGQTCADAVGWCSPSELQLIRTCCKPLLEGKEASIEWLEYYPDYGSVMVVFTDKKLLADLSIAVLGLDLHVFDMHASSSCGDVYDCSGRATDFKFLWVGELFRSNLEKFKKRFHELLSKSQKTRKNKISATGEHRGHRFTPALIWAVAKDACKCGCPEKGCCLCPTPIPSGGFMDNGAHTGGKPCNTSFPLVCSLLKWRLMNAGDFDGSVFGRLMVFFDLRIAAMWLSTTKGDREVRMNLDGVNEILVAASLKFEKLDEHRFDLVSFKDMAENLNRASEDLADGLQLKDLQTGVLKDIQTELEQPNAFRNPCLILDKEPPHVLEKVPYDEVYHRALRNSGVVPVIDDVGGVYDVEKVYRWSMSEKIRASSVEEDAWLVVSTVEEFFWKSAEDITETHALSYAQIDSLVKLLHRYRYIVNETLTKLYKAHLRKTETYSRELLVTWVVYCLLFGSIQETDGRDLPDMGVCLKYQDLEHLVLSERRLWIVVHNVKLFLQDRFIANHEMFSLRFPNATFDKGETWARFNLAHIYQAERDDAASRENGYWRAVERKKALLKKLRSELCNLQQEQCSIRVARDHAQRQYDLAPYGKDSCEKAELNRQKRLLKMKKNEIAIKNGEIEQAKKAPQAVHQPLPRSETNAYRWLFFLHMPLRLRSLATISFTAQQMLLPKVRFLKSKNTIFGIDGPLVLRQLTPRLPVDSVTKYYNGHKSSPYHSTPNTYKGTDGVIALLALSELKVHVPKPERDVERIMSKSDGVWYPDSWLPRMAWRGGPNAWDQPGVEFDPFRCKRDISVLFFTEQLESGDSLQWAMTQKGDHPVRRGNQALATQDTKPDWLSNSAFQSFSSVRAFPFQQLRQVLVSLKEDSLPWENADVQKLLCQALFHVGKLSESEEESGSFDWKLDLYDSKSVDGVDCAGNSGCVNYNCKFSEAVKVVFNHLADHLCETPSSFPRATLLGELSLFFSAWDEELKDVARRLANSLTSWAHAVEMDIVEMDGNDITKLRLKQSILLRHAIIVCCSGGNDLNGDDVNNIVLLTVKCQNLCLDAESSSPEVASLQSTCLEKITRCLNQILAIVESDQGCLTRALKQVVPDCSPHLTWKAFSERGSQTTTTCFEAKSQECVYTLNVLTGAVLVNGLPPTSLPSEVLEHSMYLRTFENMNFEVVSKGSMFVTTRLVNGRRYHFYLKGEKLHVSEVEPENGTVLELLDANEVEHWGKDLPPRLKEMHSHWLCRSENIVALRGTRFDDRDISFVLQLQYPWTQRVEIQCHILPDYLRKKALSKIKAELNALEILQLSCKEKAVSSVLEKFERRDFTHIIRTSGGEILFSFPRFGLTFKHRQGCLQCVELSGLVLSECQLLTDSLIGFHRYLILESTSQETPRKCIVVPGGQVQGNIICTTVKEDDESCSAHCKWHIYDVHPRLGTLHASDMVSRLRLAALHAATTSRLKDKLFGMTGAERASVLLRQCWTSKPLTELERAALDNVLAIARGKQPVVTILCLHILQSSEQVSFLHHNMSAGTFQPKTFSLDYQDSGQAVTMFLTKMQNSGQCNPRTLSACSELLELAGHGAVDYRQVFRHFDSFDVERGPCTNLQVASLEQNLFLGCLDHEKVPLRPEKTAFPLQYPKESSPLQLSIYEELHSSWKDHISSTSEVTRLKSDWKSHVEKIKGKAIQMMERTEGALKEGFEKGPTNGQSKNCRSLTVAFFRAANVFPKATRVDFIRAVYDPKWLSQFNPLLSPTARETLRDLCLVWLRLCVLEDKIRRIEWLGRKSDDDEIVRELTVRRVWRAKKYPSWVAFEAEQGIQIRPEQFVIAKHLIENPGHLVQLNMGMGKTRVILPLLVLHWSHHVPNNNARRITRMNILTNLFSEALEFFSNTLTGSIANLKIFLFPFCRDVVLDGRRLHALRRMINLCQEHGGMFLVSPEHRLSLELKVVELHRQGETNIAQELHRLSESSNYRDVLDESDEMLHHRYRLIYATGSVEELPGGLNRYQAPQCLLYRFRSCEAVRIWLASKCDIFVPEEDVRCEACPRFRINPQAITEQMLREFRWLIADSILDDPPHEMLWLLKHPARNQIKLFLTDPNLSSRGLRFKEDHLNDLLAIRGHLAGDILMNCLAKRHRVDYGIARPGKKRIAIPFRGADTPSLRSEFAHPDCAVLLTCLSYYSDGLKEPQLLECFKTLLALGNESKRKQYRSWYELSRGRMGEDDSFKLDCVDKIDLSNKVQFSKLAEYFGMNMKTIDFWLNSCVFPYEMQHFPERMTATSWNIAENSAGGFSGTNDNHRSLPLQVTQFFWTKETDVSCEATNTVWRSLMATNGRMLSCILEHTSGCMKLPPASSTCEALLKLVEKKALVVDAVIDSGALFAGRSNAEIAGALLKRVSNQTRIRGIIFFDQQGEQSQWKIMERSGRCLPKSQSPVAEHEAFAFFDEPRCRGSDLKLNPKALAIITLGPKMCKDKFMQAAGRMRKLGRGQKLVVAATREVMCQVRNGRNSDPKDVLEWALQNTIEANEQGILSWAVQGLFHATSHGYDIPELMVEQEPSSLNEIYGASFESVQASDVVRTSKNHFSRRMEHARASMTNASTCMVDTIISRVDALGGIVLQSARGADEECERELELERELEQEEEIAIARYEARSELDWDVSCVFHHGANISRLPKEVGVERVSAFVTKHLSPTSLCGIAWSPRVFGTRNFFITINDQRGQAPNPLNHYLRLVDMFLYFPTSREVLLVSEREADLIIGKLQKQDNHGAGSPGAMLLHLSFARGSADGIIRGLTADMLALSPTQPPRDNPLRDDSLASLQLYAGETAFATDNRKAALKAIIQGTPSKQRNKQKQPHDSSGEAAKSIVSMRGFGQWYAHSDLENIINEVSREEEMQLMSHM